MLSIQSTSSFVTPNSCKLRNKILWCTKLSRAEDEVERGRLEAEMAGKPETAAILQSLRATRTVSTFVESNWNVNSPAGSWCQPALPHCLEVAHTYSA